MASHPNNRTIVNVQLGPKYAALFHDMRENAGMTVSEALKQIICPVLDRYEESLKEAKKAAAQNAMSIEKPGYEQEIMRDVP